VGGCIVWEEAEDVASIGLEDRDAADICGRLRRRCNGQSLQSMAGSIRSALSAGEGMDVGRL
jgi:hypothetical protein